MTSKCYGSFLRTLPVAVWTLLCANCAFIPPPVIRTGQVAAEFPEPTNISAPNDVERVEQRLQQRNADLARSCAAELNTMRLNALASEDTRLAITALGT